ncbi:hypothetical protein CY0110_26153 [Crocosphaera chwakensis CCY0110]|uniref:Uncharacterized protein n=1 Tax=Crocosphaera chwakensis CCY0110 TaxID=391612 RepID=A3IPB5_9CHRO|nr:hypothetical protein CY0110_26153 [Crocosphaera chwakensis CCY0110]
MSQRLKSYNFEDCLMNKYLFAKVGFTVLTMFGMGNININSASALTITYNAGLDFSPTNNPNGV